VSDDSTDALIREIKSALTCTVPNSEGKGQGHDWGDPYKKWGMQRWYWKIWYPVRRHGYQDCVRCGYTSRRLR
jgi:hypothetical protein